MAQGSGGAILLLVAAAATLLHIAAATEFKVGGDAGWGLPSFTNVNYTDWETRNSYHIADSLLFSYNNKAHNVLVVNKVDFLSCSVVNPIATFQDGHTVINLNKTGPHFFICGVPGHCSLGQKLYVTVRGRKHATASSPAPSTSANAKGPSSSGVVTTAVTSVVAAALVTAALVLGVAL